MKHRQIHITLTHVLDSHRTASSIRSVDVTKHYINNTDTSIVIRENDIIENNRMCQCQT